MITLGSLFKRKMHVFARFKHVQRLWGFKNRRDARVFLTQKVCKNTQLTCESRNVQQNGQSGMVYNETVLKNRVNLYLVYPF